MKNDLRQLIIFTASYPNAPGETFVENEIRILEKYFERIIVICAANKQKGVDRYIPQNAEVFVFNENLAALQKLKGIPFLFKRIFWQEVRFAQKNLNINFKLIHFKILYMDLVKGYLLSKFAKNIAKNHHADSTYYYAYWSDCKAVACAFLKKKNPKIKSFARNHGWDIYFYVNEPEYLPLRNFIFKELDAIFCVSDYGVDYLKNKLKFKGTNFFVSKLGVHNIPRQIKLNKNTGPFLIVSCSNLVPIKRIYLIIDALALIEKIPVQWFHFGDGILKEELLQQANKLVALDNIELEFKGAISNKEIMTFYESDPVELFINVSRSEGIPVSIMEAMSFGIPVIATAVGGTPEIVKHGVNGYLLPANPTPEEIAETITAFYNLSIEEKIKLRQNAYNTWEAEYNAEKNYKAFVDKILEL